MTNSLRQVAKLRHEKYISKRGVRIIENVVLKFCSTIYLITEIKIWKNLIRSNERIS